jgi:hypothetical protein
MVLVAVLERRGETRLGCRLIDLIGKKRKDIVAAPFLRVDWRKRKEWCCSMGKIK